jgi:hypothetical protein
MKAIRTNNVTLVHRGMVQVTCSNLHVSHVMIWYHHNILLNSLLLINFVIIHISKYHKIKLIQIIQLTKQIIKTKLITVNKILQILISKTIINHLQIMILLYLKTIQINKIIHIPLQIKIILTAIRHRITKLQHSLANH